MEKIRMHYVFHGCVQGVGFRYRAAYSARQYGITGWVQNRYDGSVEMEAEGTAADLAAMYRTLEELRFGEITAVDAEQITPQQDRSFEIRG